MSDEKRDNWEMPKPIFRQTSGSLPKGFVKPPKSQDQSEPVDNAPDPADDILATLYAPPDDMPEKPTIVPAIKPAVDIEPQPSISEQFTVGEAVGEPEANTKRKRGFFGKIFIALGVLVLLAVAVGFFVLIYFLFFYPPSQTNNF